MKKFVIAGIILAMFIAVDGVQHISHALEVEPYLKLGTINFVENDVNEGNKFLVVAGVKASQGFDGFKGLILAEGWTMGEPMDEDRELPGKGYNVAGELRYNLINMDDHQLYPYTGLGFEYWDREASREYADSWDSVRFFRWSVGLGIESKLLFMRGGIFIPFKAKTDNSLKPDSMLGYEAEAGVYLAGFTLSFFYKRTQFDDFSSGGIDHPNFKLNLYGFSLGYRI